MPDKMLLFPGCETILSPDSHLMLGMSLVAMNEQFKLFEADYSQNGYALLNEKIRPRIDGSDTPNLSLCELHRRHGKLGVDRATAFLSHCQSELLRTTMSAIRNYVEREELDVENTFFWLDYVTLRQGKDSNDFVPDFVTRIIGVIGKTVMLAHPWGSPGPVLRIWCVFELWSALKKRASLQVPGSRPCRSRHPPDNIDFRQSTLLLIEVQDTRR